VKVNPESAIPDPSTMLLLASCLAGLGFFRDAGNEMYKVRQYSNHSVEMVDWLIIKTLMLGAICTLAVFSATYLLIPMIFS